MARATPSRRTRAPTAQDGAADEPSLNSVEQATFMIRQAILSGQYGPGERIKVADLSSQLGFSAMPLREALRKLEGEGLIEIEPNRGATVRRLDQRFIEDLFELNTELRIFSLWRGLRSLTMERLDALQDMATAYALAVENGDFETALRLNREFNTRIVEYGGNREMLRIFARGWELISAFRRRFGYGRSRQLGLAREKQLLVDVLRRQDLRGAEAILRMQHAAAIEDLISRFDKSLE